MNEALIHGYLEKRSVGRSLRTKALGGNWKRRYIVVFPAEVRWYEHAEVDADGTASIKADR